MSYTEDAELGDGRVLGLNGLDVVGDNASNLGRREGAEEVAEAFLLLLSVRRVPVGEKKMSLVQVQGLNHYGSGGDWGVHTTQWGRACPRTSRGCRPCTFGGRR